MYRTSASRLRPVQGWACNRTLTRFASSSAVTAKLSALRGLFGWLTGERSSSSPPLDFPLKDVSLPRALLDYVEQGKTRITTLKNSVKIASETSKKPVASIALFVDAGSIYERPEEFGTTHLLEHMAFKSTANQSHFRIVWEVEAIGGNVTAAASREQISYSFDVLTTYVPQMVELLIDSVRNPVFLDWEVNEQLQKVKAKITEAVNNPHRLLLEAIHSVGYSGALANPLMAPESALKKLNRSILEQFVAENYIAPRMVLAASGVDHGELLKYAEPLLSDLPSVSPPKGPESVYVGGEKRCYDNSELISFALAFEIPGGWHKEKEAINSSSGGGSFSSGGPGKGMYSRLYVRVLNEYPQIQSFSAFNSIYNNSGLFGIVATTGSDFASEAIDIAVKELIAVAIPGEVDQVQLDRAKRSAKSVILMNLETRMLVSEDMARQILINGERKPVEHFLNLIYEVSAKDIASISQRLLSSPLTMASQGNVVYVPSYDSVSSKFHSK